MNNNHIINYKIKINKHIYIEYNIIQIFYIQVPSFKMKFEYLSKKELKINN